jgi:hypothetical protein
MLLLIIILLLLFGTGGGYYGYSRWGEKRWPGDSRNRTTHRIDLVHAWLFALRSSALG